MVLWSLVLACGDKMLPHKEPNPLYRLNGVHHDLPCAACHGDADPPTPQPTSCMECHRDVLPATDHPPPAECNLCHDEWDWGTIIGGSTPPPDTGGGGTVDPTGVSCATGTCHNGGDVFPDAAPKDASHEAHSESPTMIADGLACTECHGDEPGVGSYHENGTVDLTFGGLAGSSASWDEGGQTCTVYCHGATLGAPPASPPVWNESLATDNCDVCHGFQPAAPHPPLNTCGNAGCHQGTGGADKTLNDPSKHIDGSVEF